MSSPVSTSKLV